MKILWFWHIFLSSKKIEAKKFPFNETHFFPIVPFPFVCRLEIIIPCFFFLTLIILIASSFVLFTLLNFINFKYH